MPVNEKVREALDFTTLSLPSDPPVVAVEVEDYTDSTGDPALRVLVVLDEACEVESLKGEAVSELKSAIHNSLRAHGVTVFPYIFLAKKSELVETDE